ncbi:MAG: hypothetical protein KTV72_04785, partial [Wolbachia endosymbiont of Melophagus ovinus]|nr:hypothetical protein [Wolbachia endosymbiont of Melophagus ovinus]
PPTPTRGQSPVNFASPTLMMLTEEDGSIKTQADLRKTGSRDRLVGQPSSKFDNANAEERTIPKTV